MIDLAGYAGAAWLGGALCYLAVLSAPLGPGFGRLARLALALSWPASIGIVYLRHRRPS